MKLFSKFLAAVFLLGCAVLTQAAGTGLTGEYFTTNNFTGAKSTRVDATVDFDWGTNSPGFGGLGTNNFSIRWYGQLEPRYSETYTFYVTADEGATLWVNDRLIVSRLYYSTPAQMGGQIALRANERVNIRLEYFERTNTASVRLEWTSASQAREVVPQSQLYPNTMPAERGSILREHWANLPGTAVTNLTGFTNYPNKPDGREMFLSFECLQPNWTTNVGTRLSGYVMPQTNGVYTFAVAASDTAELWMSPDTNPANNQLIALVTNATAFRDWSNQVSQVSTGRTLVAWQKYYIELRHKAGVNSNHYSVAWQPPGGTRFSVIDADYLIPAGLNNVLPAQTNIFNILTQSHPRLYATAERFAWLRQQVAINPAGQPAQWYASIYASATNLFNLTANPPVTYSLSDTKQILTQSRTVKARMHQLGLAWKISGDTNFAERAWAELNSAGNFTDWNSANSFLDTAEMTAAFGVGYDWFYEYWSPARSTFIITNIIVKGLQPGLSAYQANVGWARPTGNNWNLVCNGGLTIGALAVGTNSSIAPLILTNAVSSCAPVMQRFTTDNGPWYEGPGYWDYACDYNFRMLASLQSALGTDFGLSTTNGLNNAGLFGVLCTSANGRNFNFADTGGAGASQGPFMMWWARRFDVPAYASYQRTNNTADALSDLWWDGRGGDPVSEDIGSDILFLGPTSSTPFNPQHVGVFRSSWGDKNETFLAFKGGQMGADHGNLDAGDFVLEALGKRWAWDLGSDNYALPGYFDSNANSATNRWDYYRMRAEGQNTIVINPGNGPDTALGPVAPVLTFQSKSSARAVSVMDLTPVETNVLRAWRGFQLFGALRKQVLIQDEVVGATNATLWWFMHYQTAGMQVTLSPDGTSVTMTQGTNRLWGKILSSGGTFQIMDARPLPTSPDPAGQDLNPTFQKLAIHLTGFTNTTIAVWFVPLTLGQIPPVVPPALTPLAQWQIPQDDPPVASDGYFSIQKNTTLNVNLTTLVTDASTPVSNLVYTVTGATNGTVTLLADGVTAQFTPTPDFYSTGQFLYTATDAAGNSASAAAVITILPENWYWDTSTAAGLQPASGTWDSSTATWSAGAAGSNPLRVWPALGNDAIFTGAAGTYTVSIAGTQTVNQITTTNGTWIFTNGTLNHFNGPMTITAHANTTLNSPLNADTDLNKLGTNRLTLNAAVSFSGDVFVPAGTLRISTNNALPATASLTLGANTTAGALDLTSASQIFSGLTVITTNSALTNLITVGGSQTLAFTGGVTVGFDAPTNSFTMTTMSGGGTLVVTNAAQNVTIGVSAATTGAQGNSATLNLARLGSVTLGTTLSPLGELRIGYGNGGGSSSATLTLSDTNNSITATTVQVGNSVQNNGTSGTLMMGAGTNILTADTINIGQGKVPGTVKFASQTAGSPGSLVIGGLSGPAADIWIGYKNGAGTSANPTSTLDLRGHNATVTANTLAIAVENGANSGGEIGLLYFDGGVFTATNVIIAAKSGTSTSPAAGTLNLSGGTFTVFDGGSFTLASQTGTGAANGTLNLTGGTLNSQVDILDGAGINTSTVTLNGGTLNMFGHNLGSATNINTLTFLSGTLANVGEINAGSPLVKTGAGLLTLSGTNSYLGATTITTGELVGATGGSCSNSAVIVLAGATNGVQVLSTGGQWVCRSLTGHTNTYLDFNFGSVPPSITTAPLQVLVTFTYTNPTIIVHTTAGITNGQYPLIQYGARSGTRITNVTFIPALSTKSSYSLITNFVRSTIDLAIVSTNNNGALSWAAGNGFWDINTTANWQNGGVGGFYYQDGKHVILDDTAGGVSPILVANAVTVSPASVTVNATNKSYIISGSAMAGSGSLTKNGAGTLTLSGTNSYTGATTINAGMLLVDGNALACTNTVLVASNAVFGGKGAVGGAVTVAAGGKLAPGGLYNAGTLILTNRLALNGGRLFFDFANLSNGGTNDLMMVGGAVYLTNANSIFLSGGAPAGDYPLMTYAAASGPGTFALTANYPNVSLVVNPTNLVLHVGTGGSTFGLTWKGYVSGKWDTYALNWTNGAVTTNFNAGDNVIFDDTLAGNATITNAAPGVMVAPGLVTFNNNLTNYTVNANIGGLASLAKLGAATVTLAGTNAYTGDTIISAGELLNSSGGSCSNSTVTVLASATNGVQILTAGGQWFCSGLNTGNGSYLDFDFGSTPPSAATAPLQVLNTFTYSNPTIILRTTATAITNGQYPLIKYGARSGTAISNVTFIPAPAGNLSYSLVINAVRSTIDLVAASTNNNGALSWAAGNGYWDINTSANWQNDGVTGFYYQDGKNVILDDSTSGASPVLVTNAMTVSPASVTVNATNKSYIISGSAIAGSGSLTKNGAGSLTLSGTNSYTGATTINAGELVGVTGGSCANSAVTVLAGATNGVQVLTPGGQWLCSSLTSHTNTCLDFNFGSVIPGAATAPLQVLNTFTFTNPTIILRAATGITNGQYPLIKYGALSGTTFSVTFVPALAVSLSYSLITNTVRSTIDLLIIKASTAGALSWAAGNGYWDINTSANWQNDGVTGFYYQDGKNVILDDSASGASPVLVTNAMTVSPASVTVNATNKSYTISGSSIAGSGSLTKNGAGSLTIYCANTYAGDTTVSAGTLVIGSGGAINSPNATLNVGPDVNKAASTLAGGGAIAVKTLLATNVACGGATNSIFNFSGGMLATSNSNGLAASILLTSNASLTMNSSWNLNGGTNILSNVATNQNAAAVVYVGNGVNDVQVQVNPGATWWHAIPANSSASNILSLYVGNGNATNNAFIVNGGTLVVTNATGTAIPVAIGNSTGSVNNQLAVLNGGQVFTRCFGGGSPQSGTIGNNGNDNSAIVAGTNAAGRKAMWNFGGDRLYLGNTSSSNSWIRVDQGGVITNCQLFLWNNAPSLFITNGGQLFANAASVGRTGFNSTLIVAGADGAGNKATLAFISGSMTIGGGSVSASNPGTNNLVRVDSGGIITNVSLVSIGGSHTTYDINCISNALIITNGGQVFGTGNSTIGLNTNCNGNSASVGGGAGGSVWRFNNTALTIGNNANATNNFVTLFSGGVLTNVSSVILGGVYSRFNFNGGTLAAGASGNLLNTNNTAINAAVYVQAGGAVIDSAGFNVTNRMPLLQDTNSPGGSLTKLGSGTLTLLGTNNYTGNTTVSTGTLSVQQPAIDTNSTVTVAGGAVLNLGFSVTNPVAKLVINGVRKAQGVYNNTTDPGYLTGSGSLLVQSYAANYPTNITVNLSGSQLNMSLNMSWPATHLGWYLQSNSVNLASPNLWHDVPNSQNVINLVIPISPALTNVFYRLSNTSKP